MKKILKTLSLNPSVGFLPGGAIPYVFILCSLFGFFTYNKKDIIILIISSLFLVTFIDKTSGFLSLFAYLTGVLFFFSFSSVKWVEYKSVIIVLISILLIDSFLGFILSIGNERSYTFLGNEPSHIARFYFSLIFILYIIDSKYRKKLILLSFIFLLFNSSFTSFVFALAFSIYCFLETKFVDIIKGGILLLSILSVFFIFPIQSRFLNQFNTIKEIVFNQKAMSTDNLFLLNKIGSRRLTQSFLGYEMSKPFEGVGLGSSKDFFINNAINYNSTLRKISNISSRENIAPTSYFAQMSFEIGYINSTLFLFIVLSRKLFSNIKKIDLFLFSFGILQLLFLSTIVFVTPWLFLSLSLRKIT